MKSSLAHIIVWVSILSASIVGHGFWYATIANKSAETARVQSQIDDKKETAGRVAAARTALAEIAGDEAAVQSYFVSETDVVSFISALEARARAQSANMKVLSVSVDNSSKQPSLVLSLSVSGTFDSVMRTVGAIEYAPYDLSISKLSLIKEEKKIWNANLELVVGSVPDGASAGAKKSAQKIISILYP